MNGGGGYKLTVLLNLITMSLTFSRRITSPSSLLMAILIVTKSVFTMPDELGVLQYEGEINNHML